MKNYILTIVVICISATSAIAQKKIFNTTKNYNFNHQLSIYGSIDLPKLIMAGNPSLERTSFLYGINYYRPLTFIGKSKSTFGINAGIDYFATRQPDNYFFSDAQFKYQIKNQTYNKLNRIQKGIPNYGIKGEIGIQACFNFGKFSIIPVLNLAFAQLTKQSSTLQQECIVNDSVFNFALKKSFDTRSKGIAGSAKLRFAYAPGPLSVWLECSMLMGPQTHSYSEKLVVNETPDNMGQYTRAQIEKGKYERYDYVDTYYLLYLNLGITFFLKEIKLKNNN